jgi:hypothetical protein
MAKTRTPRKAQGLGDTIEQITEATGIKKLVEFIAGEDCGCEDRKQKLNEWFPYRKPECLTEDEYNWLTETRILERETFKPSEVTRVREPICSYIKREIRTDQINGGMVGQYNASITQRLNGLTEKTETTVTMEMPLFPEEQKAIDVQENYLDK